MICDCGNHCWASLDKGFVVLVSPEDEGLLLQSWWAARDHKGYLSVKRNDRDANGKRIQKRLAREIIRPAGRLIADHKNRNTLDNRRENLREATPRQNAQNRSTRRDSESGLKGVRRHRKKWRAQIVVDGNLILLGSFPTSEEAAQAYATAAHFHFGEFCSVGA